MSNDSVEKIRRLFIESIKVKESLLLGKQPEVLSQISECITDSILNGGKLLLCGNGGSAADAQHLAAELLVRLRPHINREAVPAIALTMDVSTITACGNDLGFECLYERMVQGLAYKGDILLAITTSGNSDNVNRALVMAQKLGVHTVGFLGGDGGEALKNCDFAFVVPSRNTGRIQESHITAGHAMLELVEDELMAMDKLKPHK